MRVPPFAVLSLAIAAAMAGRSLAQTVATVTGYGSGCVTRHASFYEFFPIASIDLAGSSMSLLFTGSLYIALPGLTSYRPPSTSATVLQLTDDSERNVALSAPLLVVGGTTTSLTVCSNGFVSVAPGNGVSFSPSAPTMLNAPQTGWRCWHDFNPASAGSGQVKFEEVAGTAYITWDGVHNFGNTGSSTFQFQFDLASGFVHCVWQTLSPLGNGYLVGYSPGGASVDPGNRDISASLALTFLVHAADQQPLNLAANARPLIGNTIHLDTTQIGASAPFGAVLLSLTQHHPGLSLAGIGMAGCSLFQGGEVSLLFLPFGAPAASTPLAIPNALGIHVFGQAFVYDPAAGLTTLGAIASNGLDLGIGNL